MSKAKEEYYNNHCMGCAVHEENKELEKRDKNGIKLLKFIANYIKHREEFYYIHKMLIRFINDGVLKDDN